MPTLDSYTPEADEYIHLVCSVFFLSSGFNTVGQSVLIDDIHR